MDSTGDRPRNAGHEPSGPDQQRNEPEHIPVEAAESQGLLRRGFLGISAFLAMLLLVVGRLFWVQALDPTGRAQRSLEQRRRTERLPALRGEIHDANGLVLARSIQRYRIVVDQTAVGPFTRIKGNGQKEKVSANQLVYELADVLKMPDNEVKDKLKGEKKYNVVAPEVTPDVYNAIVKIGTTFVSGEPVSKRNYPDGSLAGSVLGYLNNEGAQGGIELQLDEDLSGKDGERAYEISADGVRIPVGSGGETPAQDGKTVRLTLDQDIQYFAQQQIMARTQQLDAEWGTAIVMDIRDGSILALADSSMIDPNDYSKADPGDFSPRFVTQATEPGSTEKILTTSSVIESGKSEPTTVFDVPAELHIDGELITDAFVHPAQKRTLAGIVADSMNTGTVLAGKQLSKQERYDWLHKFGIAQKTGIELPNENPGILAKPEEWNVRQQYTILFGQGVSQSPLQTAMAYQAVANGGVKLSPKIVDAVVDRDGTEHKRPTKPGKRVISEQTAQKVRDIMEVVITEGGAPDAAVKGWRVGGKTGTAEAPKDDGSGYEGFTTSFFGIGPLEKPQYLVGVLLQRPQGDVHMVGTTGTFSRIMHKVLESRKVPMSTTEPVKIDKFAPGEDQNQ